MSALVELTQLGARTNSRVVAEAFEKEHKHVLAAIDDLIEKKPQLRGPKFRPTEEMVQVGAAPRTLRYYEMDRDGFTLVAMGFTGSKALDWKLAFIEAFNRMESALREEMAQSDADEPMVMRDYSPALAVIREARQIFAPKEVRALWPRLGLPDPMARHGGSIEFEQIGGSPVDDSIIDWRNACSVDEEGAVTSASELWDSYRAWCDETGRTCANRTRFGRAVAALGYGLARYGGGYVHRVGIKLVA